MNTLEEQLETWRPISGTDGDYEISDEGRIRSLDYNHTGRPAVLKLDTMKNGYLRVTYYANGSDRKQRRKRSLVHSLVLREFIGARPTGRIVNHKNGIKSDNRLFNLEYCTPSENTIHSFANGLQIGKRGSSNHFAKLDETQVREIRTLFLMGARPCDIAREFGISSRGVRDIRDGKNWKHLPDLEPGGAW